MKTIWKFILHIATNEVSMPEGAEILSAGMDPNGNICAWALVDPARDREVVMLHVVGTGGEFDPGEGFRYIGKAVDEVFVWHVLLPMPTQKGVTP